MRKKPVSFQMLMITSAQRAVAELVSQLMSRFSTSLSIPFGCSTTRQMTETATQLIASGRK